MALAKSCPRLLLRAVRIPLHEVAPAAVAARTGTSVPPLGALTDRAMAMLTDTDRRRIAPKVRPQDRLRGAISTILLHQAAGMGATIERHPQGRPVVVGGSDEPALCIDANTSHHGDYVVCGAVRRPSEGYESPWRRIGVDVLSLSETPGPESLAAFARYLSPTELQALKEPSLTSASGGYSVGFSVIWSLKEAMVKALGYGITGVPPGGGLSDVDFLGGEATRLQAAIDAFAAEEAEVGESGCIEPFWEPSSACITGPAGSSPLGASWRFGCYRLDRRHLLSVALWGKPQADSTSMKEEPGASKWFNTPVGAVCATPVHASDDARAPEAMAFQLERLDAEAFVEALTVGRA